MASHLAVVSFSAFSHGVRFIDKTMAAILQELTTALDGTEDVTKVFLHAGNEFANLNAAIQELVATRSGCRMEQQRGKTVINLPNGKVVGFVVVDDAPAMPWPAVPVPVQDVPVPAAAAVDLDDSHTTLGDDSDELAEIRNLANPPSRPRFTRRTNRNRRTCNQNLDDSDDSDTLLDVSGWGLTQEM